MDVSESRIDELTTGTAESGVAAGAAADALGHLR